MSTLEKVAINDVLSLKAARSDATADLKCFWAWVHERPDFDGFNYIRYAAPSYTRLASAQFFSLHMAKFEFRFAELRVRSLAMKQNAEFAYGG